MLGTGPVKNTQQKKPDDHWWMKSYILEISRKDRKRNVWFQNETGFYIDIILWETKRKWNWAGDLMRNEERWAKRIIEWTPRDWKRNRGRPRFGIKKWSNFVHGPVYIVRQTEQWKSMAILLNEVWCHFLLASVLFFFVHFF